MRDLFKQWVLKYNIGPSMNDQYLSRRNNLPVPKNYSGFDGVVGDGWLPILDKLASDLIEMGWDRDLHQVKEKYGTLRFYIGAGSSEMLDRISEASRESAKTCETCGEAGKLRGHTWLYTACDAHTEKRDTDKSFEACPGCDGGRAPPIDLNTYNECKTCSGWGTVRIDTDESTTS